MLQIKDIILDFVKDWESYRSHGDKFRYSMCKEDKKYALKVQYNFITKKRSMSVGCAVLK